jgi:hypothetical protein
MQIMALFLAMKNDGGAKLLRRGKSGFRNDLIIRHAIL